MSQFPAGGSAADESIHVVGPEAQFRDDDSALGDEDLLSTSSLTSTIFDFLQENGRTYNRYGERAYVLPNDEMELDRLDLQHHLMKMTFEGRLMNTTFERQNGVHHVLDVGTGTGIWAIEYGDIYPDSIVTGIDVSPVQPSFVPPNVNFEIADLDYPWTFSHSFDVIFCRMMTGAFTRWGDFIEQCYENLTPGGVFEIQDITFNLRSDDSSLPRDSALATWANLMLEASNKLCSPLNSIESVKQLMVDAGFVDIKEVISFWPINSWPKEAIHQKVGTWTFHNFTSSLSGISLALFTRGLGWTKDELEVFLVDVRNDMKNKSYHAYWPIYSFSGRKQG